MQTVRCTEGAGAPPAGTRAAGLAARPGTGQPPQTPGQRWQAFALLVGAYFITIVDFTIVNVALPSIGRKLHFPESDLQWVVTAYGLTFAGFLLLGGRAADLLGRRRLLMVGLAVFTCASLGGGLATSDTFLIVMRGIPGTRGGARAPRRAADRDEHVLRGGRTQQGAGHLGRGGRAGRDGWAPRRRRPHHLCRVAVHLLLQRPHRRSRANSGPQVGTREPCGQRAAALRPLRCRLDHRRSAGLRVRHLPGAASRLGGHSDRRHALSRGGVARGVLGYRNESRGAAPAAAAVPAEQRGRVERGRLPAGNELSHVCLLGHPLHAAGPRVLRSCNRGGLDDGVRSPPWPSPASPRRS